MLKHSTTKNQTEFFYGSKADEWDPAVSPDGSKVAFSSKLNGTWDIWVSSIQKPEKPERFTQFGSDEWDPAFHPNGKIMVFAATNDGPRAFGLCID